MTLESNRPNRQSTNENFEKQNLRTPRPSTTCEPSILQLKGNVSSNAVREPLALCGLSNRAMDVGSYSLDFCLLIVDFLFFVARKT